MSRRVWRDRWKIWVPALVFFVLNLAVFSTYRLVFAGQAMLRSRQIEDRNAELARLGADRAGLEDLVARAERNREKVDVFYDHWLRPESERLTEAIAEVKDLATKAGVEPYSLSYPEQEIDEFGLEKRSIVFAVEGSYMALRRFINFLELSDLFLTLEEVTLSGTGDGATGLRINLKIATLFADEAAFDEARAAGAASGSSSS